MRPVRPIVALLFALLVGGQGVAPSTLPQRISSGNSLLALEYSNAAGTPVKIEIFPSASIKPDEGNAAVAGTTAWAMAQLSAGSEIQVHAGSYAISTTITVTPGVSLICDNPQTAVYSAAASFNSIMFKVGWAGSQTQGAQIRNCGISGASGSNASGTSVWVRDTANTLIQDNYFTNAALNALIIDATASGAVYNRVINNNFAECREECLVLNGAASNSTDNWFVGNSIGGSVTGDGTKPWMTVNGIGSLQFIGNHISGPTHTDCLVFNGASQTDIQIVGNEIENCNNRGIVLGGGFNSVISGNVFYANGVSSPGTYTDIDVGASFNTSIVGNSFRAQTKTKNAVFSSSGSYFNTVTGNIFNGYSGFAISLLNAFSGGNTIGQNSYYGNAGTYTLGGSHFYPSSVALSTTGVLSNVPGELNSNSLQLTALASGPTPAITTQGTAGAATWTYVIVPKDINANAAPAGTAGSTTTGNATLTSGNFNVVTWGSVNGAYSYDIYRTAVGSSPSTTGLIGNVLATAIIVTAANNYTFNDTGVAGNSAAAPSTNATGSIQVPGAATLSGLPSSAGSGGLYVCVDSTGKLYLKAACP